MRTVWARLGTAVAVALTVGVGAASADIVPKGKTAPAWSGKSVQGKTVSSGQYKGKVVLLNFFSYY